MAGKITYLRGPHPSSIGCIVAPVNITDFDKLEIEKALNRALDDAEKSTIEGGLELCRSEYLNQHRDIKLIQELRKDRAVLKAKARELCANNPGSKFTHAIKTEYEKTLLKAGKVDSEIYNLDIVADSQSVRKTLARIGKPSGEKARAAYADLDSKSDPLILKALHDLGASNETIQAPPGDLISKAASRALDNLSTKSGPPEKVYQKWLADYVLNCWQSLGGKEDDKAHAQDNSTMSPLARFGVALFSSVEKDKVDATGVAKLLRAAKKRRASTR